MKWWVLFIALVVAATGRAQDVEIVPCQHIGVMEKPPTCCLKRTDLELILYQGDQEVKRFQISAGPNLVERDHINDDSLLIALQTLRAMRAVGACK